MTVSLGVVGDLNGVSRACITNRFVKSYQLYFKVLILRRKRSQQAASSPHRTTPKIIPTTSTMSRKLRFQRAKPSRCASLTFSLKRGLIISKSMMRPQHCRMAPCFGHVHACLMNVTRPIAIGNFSARETKLELFSLLMEVLLPGVGGLTGVSIDRVILNESILFNVVLQEWSEMRRVCQ